MNRRSFEGGGRRKAGRRRKEVGKRRWMQKMTYLLAQIQANTKARRLKYTGRLDSDAPKKKKDAFWKWARANWSVLLMALSEWRTADEGCDYAGAIG
jgi:hypothetical protein